MNQSQAKKEIQTLTKAIEEHIAILTALKAREFERAVAHMETHLQTALRTLLESAIKQ